MLLYLQDINVAANEVEEAEDEGYSDTELDDAVPADSAMPAESAAAAVAAAGAAESATAAAAEGVTARLSGPAVQLLISSCWTTWKEASLLIGALAGRLPLPKPTHTTNTNPSSSGTVGKQGAGVPGTVPEQQDRTAAAAGGGTQQQQQQQQVIECEQLDQLGSLQLSMLLSMKHNGAVEKSQAGFITLVGRLLESPEPCLNLLPRVWLGRCLSRVQQPGQCRDDIVRRSAGALGMIDFLCFRSALDLHQPYDSQLLSTLTGPVDTCRISMVACTAVLQVTMLLTSPPTPPPAKPSVRSPRAELPAPPPLPSPCAPPPVLSPQVCRLPRAPCSCLSRWVPLRCCWCRAWPTCWTLLAIHH
jgi:hypothetical protein